ncbi:MAG: tRNA pseudouridine(13) synthase TruD [Candidatus Woesearchaeota archaeon]|nr:MAG: tRNA pseudouridine(13) synthase TruD [Candidatus Woesearchaeota archaeon]
MIIKKLPEDFIVEEIPLSFSGFGEYAIYRLTKINYNTESAINYLCKNLRINKKNIKYAGLKDKHALTTQYISIYKDSGKLMLNNDDLKLEFVSFNNEPLSLGHLIGNKFKIIIREITEEELRLFNEKISEEFVFPNYFDDQRFSQNNLEIGISILKRDFKRACELLNLEAKENNYVNCLRNVPLKTLLLYIHSVQAYFFNLELTQKIIKMGDYYLRKYRHGTLAFLKKRNYEESLSINLVGFDNDNPILKEKGLSSKDFIIKQFPELSVEGIERKCFIKTNINYKINDKEIYLEFFLPKGSYATMLIKALF